DANQQARLATLELDRLAAGPHDLLLRREPPQHPADRRLALGRTGGIDRAGHDEALLRARHRDVVEAQPLGPFLLLLGLAHCLVVEDRLAVARRRMDDAEAEAAVRAREDLVRSGRRLLAARVGDDDDLELE